MMCDEWPYVTQLGDRPLSRQSSPEKKPSGQPGTPERKPSEESADLAGTPEAQCVSLRELSVPQVRAPGGSGSGRITPSESSQRETQVILPPLLPSPEARRLPICSPEQARGVRVREDSGSAVVVEEPLHVKEARAELAAINVAVAALKEGDKAEAQWRQSGKWEEAVVRHNYGTRLLLVWCSNGKPTGEFFCVPLSAVAPPGRSADKLRAQRVLRDYRRALSQQRRRSVGESPAAKRPRVERKKTPEVSAPSREQKEQRVQKEEEDEEEGEGGEVYFPPGQQVRVRFAGATWDATVLHTPADSDAPGRYEVRWKCPSTRTEFVHLRDVFPPSDGTLEDFDPLPRFENGDVVTVSDDTMPGEGTVVDVLRRGGGFVYSVSTGPLSKRLVQEDRLNLKLRDRRRAVEEEVHTTHFTTDASQYPTQSEPRTVRRRGVEDEDESDSDSAPHFTTEELPYVWFCRRSGPLEDAPEPPPKAPPRPPTPPAPTTTGVKVQDWWWASSFEEGGGGKRAYNGVRVGDMDFWVGCSVRFKGPDGREAGMGTLLEMYETPGGSSVVVVSLLEFISHCAVILTPRRALIHPSDLVEKIWILERPHGTTVDPPSSGTENRRNVYFYG
eukprot:Hpha_TRINITY_DN15936_c2_g5::TRINITY_DN15936_c2_g5_i1::g.75127::m.75127